MSALDELAKWNRKGYKFRIESGGNYMPGDGVVVTLQGGGRKVEVDELELPDGSPIGDIVTAAIDRWHDDNTLKNYRLYWLHDETYPMLLEKSVKWKWYSNKIPIGKTRMVEARLKAHNEYEAKKMISDGYPLKVPDLKITAYETKEADDD